MNSCIKKEFVGLRECFLCRSVLVQNSISNMKSGVYLTNRQILSNEVT